MLDPSDGFHPDFLHRAEESRKALEPLERQPPRLGDNGPAEGEEKAKPSSSPGAICPRAAARGQQEGHVRSGICVPAGNAKGSPRNRSHPVPRTSSECGLEYHPRL